MIIRFALVVAVVIRGHLGEDTWGTGLWDGLVGKEGRKAFLISVALCSRRLGVSGSSFIRMCLKADGQLNGRGCLGLQATIVLCAFQDARDVSPTVPRAAIFPPQSFTSKKSCMKI